MGTEHELPDDFDAAGHVVTHVYDIDGNFMYQEPQGRTTIFVFEGSKSPQVPPSPRPKPLARQATPLRVEVFEFRLAGSEAKEACKKLSDRGPWAVAARSVRAYLTADAGNTARATAIAGVGVHVELHEDAVVCRAELSDFAPAELVVVQVEVSIWRVPDPYADSGDNRPQE